MLADIMTIARFTALCVTSLLVLGAACDDSDDPADDGLRHIHFDAAEVAETLADDPNTVLLVDLRQGNVVHFDRSGQDFDFSNFMALCPSMPTPIPMTAFLERLDLRVDGIEYWTMQSAETDAPRFRSFECQDKVCDSYGGDCQWFCEPAF